MSRKIKISKYQGNTVYSVHVVDSYGTEHHFGYCSHLNEENNKELEEWAEEIWANEIAPEEDLLANAIHEMVQMDKRYTDSRGNHRDGLD